MPTASADEAAAERALAAALGPELPLLLELVNRGLRQKLHAAEARTLFGGLAARTGEAVLERALARALRDAIAARSRTAEERRRGCGLDRTGARRVQRRGLAGPKGCTRSRHP